MRILNAWDAADALIKREKEGGRACKQCGFRIIRGGSHIEDKVAHDLGFCGSGCESVYAAMLRLAKGGAL